MSKSTQFSQERNLKDSLPAEISILWQQGLFDSFSGVGGVNIHYALFIHTSTSHDKEPHKQVEYPAIVVVPGRGECYLKYNELAYDLYQQGYNVFILDHRGQGLSGRLLSNLQKGYVTNFQDYVDDLQYFIEHVVDKYCSTKPYLLAHSMGGAIAVRFMQDSPNAIKAAVISSPMLGFNSGFLPNSLAKKLVAANYAVNNLISNNPWYFFGQKNYSPTSFIQDRLTHSTKRYKEFVDLYKQNTAIQLGGVTTHWLMQGIMAQKEIFNKLGLLKTPILLFQAGADRVVCQQAQNNFCHNLHLLQPQSCPNGVPIRFDDAYHELLFESDKHRNKAITRSLSWFKKH